MAIIEPYIPPPNKRGRSRAHAAHQILDASFYVLRAVVYGGWCPASSRPGETVYCWFWEVAYRRDVGEVNVALRERLQE
jgi:transposase